MTPPALGALVMLSAVMAGCGRCDGAGTAPLGSSADAGVAALQVEVSGCAAVRRGPVCELDAAHRELVLWIDAAPDTAVEIRSNGAPLLPTSMRDGAGGKTVVVVVPSGAGDLTASVSREGTRRERRLSLEDVAPEDTLVRVRALRKEGKLDEAAAVMPAWSTFPEPHRARARSLAARLALAGGRVDDAIVELRAAMAMHRAEGRLSDEVLDAMALAHTLLTHGRRIAEAREVLDGVAPALLEWDEGRAQIGYYRALVSRDAGDIRGALRELRESQRASERLGLATFARTISEASARLFQMSGEHERALAVHRALEGQHDERTPPCERARVSANVLWSELAMRGATLSAVPSMVRPTSAPKEALRSIGGAAARPNGVGESLDFATRSASLERALGTCTGPVETANGRTNLALAALVVGDVSRAEAEVRAARAAGPPPAFVAEWLLDIEARIALARGDTRGALARYDELAARAEAARSPEAVWRAALGRGVALETAKDDAGAEKAYRAAEGMLEDQSAQVPLNDGRAGFLAERDRSARHLADMLLRRGDVRGAWDVVRRARSRALRSTQRLDHVAALAPDLRHRWEQAMARYAVERDALEKASVEAWSVPADQLETFSTAQRAREDRARAALDDAFAAIGEAQPRLAEVPEPVAGDLELAFQPSADGRRLHILARTAARARVVTVDALPSGASDDQLAEVLLGAFDLEIEQAKRIRVFDYGPLAAVDLHALPWRQAPLLAHAPVEYPTDIGARVLAAATPAGERRALVVFDTRGDLPQSRAEAEAVRGALADAWETRSLQGSAATRSAVSDAMGGVTLFHFASHASFDGAEVWDSALALADGGLLRAGDVLALQRTPELVVLSGCDTGKAGASRVADMSVARAFIARGSRLVVATSRPVEDELAATLLAKAYAGASSNWDLAESLRSAQLEASRSAPASDWRAYRIITP